MRRTVTALIGVLLAAVVLTGCGSDDKLEKAQDQVAELKAEQSAGNAALKEARTLLVDMTTYSWKKGKHDFAWVDRLTNADLKDKLAPNVPKLKKLIVKEKVRAQGKILDAAARVVDATQVEIVAFVDQALTRGGDPQVNIDEQRVSMTLVLKDDTWMVDRLDLHTGTNSGE